MKALFIPAFLLVCAMAAADPQPATPPADQKAARERFAAENAARRAKMEAQRSQMKALADQERAAMDAVRKDSAKSPTEKAEANRKIHEEFRLKRDAIISQIRADHQAMRAKMEQDRKALREGRAPSPPAAIKK